MKERNPHIRKFIADEEYREVDLVHRFSAYPSSMEDEGEITILTGQE